MAPSAASQVHSHLQSSPIGAMLLAMLRRLGIHSIYVLTGFPLALVGFVVIITGLSLGFGLAITIIGIPILIGVLLAARGLAQLERMRFERMLAIDPGQDHYRGSSSEDGSLKRLLTPLIDMQSWLDALHAIISFPVTILTWTVAIAWWTTAVGGTTWALWGWSVPNGTDNDDLPELIGLGSNYVVRAGFYTVIGLVCAVSLPFVMAGLAQITAAAGRLLLVIPSTHRRQVDQLKAGRDATRAAEDSSLRRLERDIHDGPQQRLVRLSMDLGRAEQKVGDNSPDLASALSDAKRQTQDTLDELRALSRGIAPPILADRGLRSALEELAAGSVIPASCVVDVGDQRLAPYVETAIYFVVAEALTNATKHSGATGVWIEVGRSGSTARATIIDNGIGGAHPSKGHGLSGLMERVRGADGILDIQSPDGGPTSIIVEVPCG